METVTITEAARLIGVNETWVYRLVKSGRIRAAQTGRRGTGKHTLVSREDVERERERRREMLRRRLEGL